MAKLRCDLHGMRVHVVKDTVLHKGGWGDTCKTETVSIGGKTYTAAELKNRETK